MVDARIARYVASEGKLIGFRGLNDVEKTLQRYREKASPGVLTLYDWAFVEMWVEWCREKARELSRAGEFQWRARDVEMAVFRAWGEGHERRGWPDDRPRFTLSSGGKVTLPDPGGDTRTNPRGQ